MIRPSSFDVGWALVRVVFGAHLAALHGYTKIFEGKMPAFTKTVAELGFPFPSFFAWSASLTELVGGGLVAIGLFTRPAACAAAGTMAVALYRHRVDPYAKMELAVLYFAVMVCAALVGSGRFGFDRRLGLR